MAVELMSGYESRGRMEENAVQEAASAGFESVEKLIRLLSQSQQGQRQFSKSVMDIDSEAVVDLAVNNFKKVISLLDRTRTGHARFRKAPVAMAPPSQSQSHELQNLHKTEEKQSFVQPHQKTVEKQSFVQPHQKTEKQSFVSRVYCPAPIKRPPPPLPHNHQKPTDSINFSSSPANSFVSSITGETDRVKPSRSMGKPPLPSSSLKRKCISMDGPVIKCGSSSSGRCHCSKKRKSMVKRVLRLPAISLRLSDIPPDDYSWRKYGQKPIKGSPHPRGYYKCSSVKDCPARKHIERAMDDPSMLIVTYESDHNHPRSVAGAYVLESST